MMKALAAAVAGLLCMWAGIRHAAALRADVLRLARWTQVLDQLALILSESAMPLTEAFKQAASGHQAPDKILKALAQELPAHPLMPLAAASGPLLADLPESAVLQRMFTGLGHGTLDSRVLAIRHAKDEIALMVQAAQTRSDKDAKLSQTLGLTGGICLFILLI